MREQNTPDLPLIDIDLITHLEMLLYTGVQGVKNMIGTFLYETCPGDSLSSQGKSLLTIWDSATLPMRPR